jgi:PAS domain S-box-containing protein
MTSWLIPAIISTLGGTIILFLVYLFLYFEEREGFLGIWALAWGCYALRFAFMLGNVHVGGHPVLLAGNQIFALANGLFLLWGTYAFIGRTRPDRWIAALVLGVVWVIVAVFQGVSFFWLTLPTFGFMAITYVWTGVVLLRHRRIDHPSRHLVGWIFIAWGIHKANYPVLRPVVWIAPFGYLLGALLEMVVAVSILMLYFQRNRMELAANEERLRTITDNAPDLILQVDAEGRVIFSNGGREGTGTFPRIASGDSIHDWPATLGDADGPFLTALAETLADGRSREIEVEGADRWYRLRLAPAGDGGGVTGVIVIAADITDRKIYEAAIREREARMRQSQKLEAIGILAGGIAHDFNNILAAIMGYTELSLTRIKKDDPLHRNLTQVMKSADRAKELIQQILSFSRNTNHEKKPVRVAFIIKESIKLLRSSLPRTIEIQDDIALDAGPVLADPSQIQQIIMNISTNAAQAMDDGGGVLSITLKAIHLDSLSAGQIDDLAPGPYVHLTVSDTGHGMSAGTLDRIFVPFFTTRSPGEGTGMGLSVVYGIVESLGGAVKAYSEPEKGTTISIYLPCIDGEETASTAPETAAPTGTERILFVDDEPALVEVAENMLSLLGYQVTCLTSSREALCRFRAAPDAVDLVITDQTMPEMTGIELAGEMMAIRPDLPVILCTGFSQQVNEERAAAHGIRRFLMKPMVMRDVAQGVREVLDASVAPSPPSTHP